jgi:hypothetical protein
MQQFRPLQNFDARQDAEPRQRRRASTGDSVPTQANPPFAAPNRQVGRTNPQMAAPNWQFTGTEPRLTATNQRAGGTNPRMIAPGPQQFSPSTSARLPVVMFDDAGPTVNTDRLVGLTNKMPATGKYPSLASALQATMNTGSTASRLVVIPGSRGRKRTGKAPRRLNPRLRQAVVLLATLVVIIFTLTTLVPLSDNQNGGNIFSNINGWIRSAQLDWNIQAHQGNDNIPTQLNGPGLPYMAIANSPYVAVAVQAARDAGIPPVYFVRQIQQESGFNPNAVSVTNAQGIAQFEPGTAAGLGINPWDPYQALPGAARLMANYNRQYGSYAKALGAYNAGSGTLQSAIYACGMYWLSCMPAQTQNYVYRITGM